VTHAVAEPDKKRAWLRTGLITGAALVLAGLIFSAGVAVGWVGGRFDRFDRRDQVGDRMEQVFGDSDRQSRRDRIEECFFSNDSGRRDDSCPPFMRDDDGRFGEGRGNGSRGSDGRGGPGQSGRNDDGELPVPPVGGQGNTGSSTDQPVIVYPDGRVVPLEPNTTAPAPAPVPIGPTPVPIGPTPPVTPPAGQ